jgi:single-stranded-DNA-specific exonuclease
MEEWILLQSNNSSDKPPESFIKAVKKSLPNREGIFAAQLLWHRGIRDESQLESFVNPKLYQPSSAFEFGEEMQWAVERLKKARDNGEKVCIWGDFDADGITSTSVLWDGLGEFFPQHLQLIYYIPNRFTESHGLNNPGIDKLVSQGVQLIVTCDTGSTNLSEIIYAKQLNIDVIITDHHTLPSDRPPVVAIINPRYLRDTHPLFHLSGVAVAYKLVEAVYESLPDIPRQPLSDLLDLVAIGLIADLVQLSGDCRYLAQMGIKQLQADSKKEPSQRRRPGVGKLLDLCRKSGDRPTDISFGLGPRINAVSRIQGDVSFCVELLTSRNLIHCENLAEETELANTRRKSIQKDVAQDVSKKLSKIDLSTTSVIVLEDSQWSLGVLGLVAGQIAQETGRPTILFTTEASEEFSQAEKSDISNIPLARGSARSINSVDLYKLVKDQSHLLHRFGGHPFAAGLSMAVENIPLFTQAINQQLKQTLAAVSLTPVLQADLRIQVADLVKDSGKELFDELKVLEPCGMGNPAPKLLIQDCWFENPWNRNIKDIKGKEVKFIKTEFKIRDNSTNIGFPGIWWGHYKDELSPGRYDAIVELDHNSFKSHYEVRLLAVRPAANTEVVNSSNSDWILDWRNINPLEYPEKEDVLVIKNTPTSWDDIRAWIRRSLFQNQRLAIAWRKTGQKNPKHIWLTLVGIAKYLNKTQKTVTRVQLLEKLGISDRSLLMGVKALTYLGFDVSLSGRFLQINWSSPNNVAKADTALEEFFAILIEEQFQQRYFAEVSVSTIKAIAERNIIGNG